MPAIQKKRRRIYIKYSLLVVLSEGFPAKTRPELHTTDRKQNRKHCLMQIYFGIKCCIIHDGERKQTTR